MTFALGMGGWATGVNVIGRVKASTFFKSLQVDQLLVVGGKLAGQSKREPLGSVNGV
jgi:hypothetical protein